MHFRVIFLLGCITFEITASSLDKSQLSSCSSFICQYQLVEDRYGLCTLGCTNKCQNRICFLQNHDDDAIKDPAQKKYSNSDNCCVLTVATLLCCRGKLLVGCDNDDISTVDLGCAVNCIGLDCSPAAEYGLCELFCSPQQKYYCPIAYDGTRSSSCFDGDICCFKQAVSTERMQDPFSSSSQNSR